MQIIFLSEGWTVALCFLIWPALQVGAALLCLRLPDRFYSSSIFLFRVYQFEQKGLLYERLFHVRRWKRFLPDGGTILGKNSYKKKRLTSLSNENLQQFCIESARGELTHWLPIPFFWVFGFFIPFHSLGYMLIYALLVNLPCIVVQRYNRPRVQQVLLRRGHPLH